MTKVLAFPALVCLWLAAAMSAAAAAPCRADTYADASYTVCTFAAATADVRVFWRNVEGAPYKTFGALAESLAAQHLTVAFAINGGMYREDFSPVGLHIENGRQLHGVNTASAAGVSPLPNFYKKPNGVFFMARKTAVVMSTDRFIREKPKADFATQSGPMLVIDGKLHPSFIAGSLDITQRSGVGVRAGEVMFVISESAVNFDAFARYFRDRLGCPNALFLDGGSAPGIYAPEMGRNDLPGHGGYGPIIAVVQKVP